MDDYTDKIILTDKPRDITSAKVVYFFKKNFNIRKIGHAGTLDPRATGLLILCTDSMTKIIADFMDYEKEYEGVIKIGKTTPTFDTESEETDFKDISNIKQEDIEKIRLKFKGEISQTPPIYSALKQKGKPVYKLARKGRPVYMKPRKIIIHSFDITGFEKDEIFFRIICSKGTYIRTLANDFGRELGVGGYLYRLRRTRIGIYNLEGLNKEIQNIKYKIIN